MEKTFAVYWNNEYIGEATKISVTGPLCAGVPSMSMISIQGKLQIKRGKENASNNKKKRL